MSRSVIRSPDQLTGQRFHEESSYSTDPELNETIRENIASSRYTIADLKPPELKRILRLYDVEPKRILEANTTKKLVDLSVSCGIVDVPDEWTLDRLLSQKKERQAAEFYKKTHLSVTKAE